MWERVSGGRERVGERWWEGWEEVGVGGLWSSVLQIVQNTVPPIFSIFNQDIYKYIIYISGYIYILYIYIWAENHNKYQTAWGVGGDWAGMGAGRKEDGEMRKECGRKRHPFPQAQQDDGYPRLQGSWGLFGAHLGPMSNPRTLLSRLLPWIAK